MLYGNLPLGLNGVEALSVAVFAIGLVVYGQRWDWSRRDAMIALVLVLPVLLLTAAEATQFMTMDERGISHLFMDPRERGLSQIMDSAFFTGGALIELPLVRLLQLARLEPTVIRMLLKAVWWFIGNVIVAGIAADILRLRRPGAAPDPLLFGGVFAAIALLPTTQLALKTVNYDLLSFGPGALAALVFARRLSTWRDGLYPAALVLASLAAQEKATAGPVLIVIIATEALLRADRVEATRRRPLVALRSAGSGMVVALAIAAASLSVYRLFGPPKVPPLYWMSVLAPIATWAQTLVGLFVHGWGRQAASGLWLAMGFAVPLATLALISISAAALPLVRLLSSFWSRLPPAVPFALLALLTVGIFGAGVAGAQILTGYWAPYHATAMCAVPLHWGSVILHTNANTLWKHYFNIVSYTIVVMVVAIPSAVWGLAAVGLGVASISRVARTSWNWAIPLLLIAASLVQPIATAAAGIPFASRYFDLSLALFASGLLFTGLASLPHQVGGKNSGWRAAILVLAICLIAETAPFRPLFAAFRPFWLSYADAKRAEIGRLNASWMGWGEDGMIAGKRLDARCAAHDPVFAGHRCADVTLYVMDDGLWLPGPQRIRTAFFSRERPPPIDEKGFFLFDRLYLIQGVYHIPRVTPDFAVSYRGHDLAWGYRGDRLAASSYDFGPVLPQGYTPPCRPADASGPTAPAAEKRK